MPITRSLRDKSLESLCDSVIIPLLESYFMPESEIKSFEVLKRIGLNLNFSKGYENPLEGEPIETYSDVSTLLVSIFSSLDPKYFPEVVNRIKSKLLRIQLMYFFHLTNVVDAITTQERGFIITPETIQDYRLQLSDSILKDKIHRPLDSPSHFAEINVFLRSCVTSFIDYPDEPKTIHCKCNHHYCYPPDIYEQIKLWQDDLLQYYIRVGLIHTAKAYYDNLPHAEKMTAMQYYGAKLLRVLATSGDTRAFIWLYDELDTFGLADRFIFKRSDSYVAFPALMSAAESDHVDIFRFIYQKIIAKPPGYYPNAPATEQYFVRAIICDAIQVVKYLVHVLNTRGLIRSVLYNRDYVLFDHMVNKSSIQCLRLLYQLLDDNGYGTEVLTKENYFLFRLSAYYENPECLIFLYEKLDEKNISGDALRQVGKCALDNAIWRNQFLNAEYLLSCYQSHNMLLDLLRYKNISLWKKAAINSSPKWLELMYEKYRQNDLHVIALGTITADDFNELARHWWIKHLKILYLEVYIHLGSHHANALMVGDKFTDVLKDEVTPVLELEQAKQRLSNIADAWDNDVDPNLDEYRQQVYAVLSEYSIGDTAYRGQVLAQWLLQGMSPLSWMQSSNLGKKISWFLEKRTTELRVCHLMNEYAVGALRDLADTASLCALNNYIAPFATKGATIASTDIYAVSNNQRSHNGPSR